MNKWKWWSFMSIVCIMDKWVPTPLHYFTLILGLNGAEASLPIIVYLMYSTQLEKASVKDRIWIFSMVGSGFSTFKREYCNLLLLTVILIKKIFFALFIIWHDLTSLFSISALLNVSFENQNFLRSQGSLASWTFISVKWRLKKPSYTYERYPIDSFSFLKVTCENHFMNSSVYPHWVIVWLSVCLKGALLGHPTSSLIKKSQHLHNDPWGL